VVEDARELLLDRRHVRRQEPVESEGVALRFGEGRPAIPAGLVQQV
jgi:hypothetical protein